jgi:hypothetical protein
MSRYVRGRLCTDGQSDTFKRLQKMEEDMRGSFALSCYAVLAPNRQPIVACSGLTDPAPPSWSVTAKGGAMSRTQVQVRPARVLLASVPLMAATWLLLLLARSLGATPVEQALAALIGLVVMPAMASPIEWLVHRYVYHRPFTPLLRSLYDIHHRVHHYVFFPTWRYVTAGEPRRIPLLARDHEHAHVSPMGNAMVHLSHFTFYMLLAAGTIWLPGWLLTHSVPLLVGMTIASVVVCDLMVTVHDTIHRPGAHPWIERQGWFRFLDRHHYIHHVDTEANVNFLLPLADLLYGTMRRTMTEEEINRHGTWQEAKAVLIGHGEPAHEAFQNAGLTRPGIMAARAERPARLGHG